MPLLHLLERSQLQWARCWEAEMKIERQSDFVKQMGGKLTEVTLQSLARVCVGGWEAKLGTRNVHMDYEIVQDSAGFVSNRISHLFMNEAAFLVYEGVAKARRTQFPGPQSS